jgi:hypothetical protein
MDSLAYATARIPTGSATDDSTYVALQAKLADWGARRDELGGRINNFLDGLSFGGASTDQATNARLTAEAKALTAEVHAALP